MNSEIKPVMENFNELLGQYWNLAYDEGKTGDSHGDKANEVLSNLRAANSSLEMKLEASQNEVINLASQEANLQTENAKLKEESQNYENAVRIVQEWSGQLTLANEELRRETEAQAKRISELEIKKLDRHELNDKELSDQEYVKAYIESMNDSFDEAIKYQAELKSTIESQAKRIAHQQFLIDSLMIEYCPDEMTVEQLENWKVHQRKVEL